MPSLLHKTRFRDAGRDRWFVVADDVFCWKDGKSVVSGAGSTAVNNAGTRRSPLLRPDPERTRGLVLADTVETAPAIAPEKTAYLLVLDGGAKVAGTTLSHALYVSAAEYDGLRLAGYDFSPDRDAALHLPRMTAAALRGQLRARFGVAARVVLAADYGEMFRALLAVEPEYGKVVQREIDWARKQLKKQDRIVWYLRWVRLACAKQLWAQLGKDLEAAGRPPEPVQYTDIRGRAVPQPGATGPQPQQGATDPAPAGPGYTARYKALQAEQERAGALFQQYAAEMRAKGGDPDGAPALYDGLQDMKHNLEHFLGLQVPEIQSYSPKYENWRTLYNLFSSYEQAWKEKAKSLIKPLPQDTVWMQFPDGWAWWLLPRACCDDESRAMGHCGNSPMRGRTDVRILSLRQPVRRGQTTYWEPHCTFILHDGGVLGEMKGKNNDKPTQRYHNYIVALLKDRRIAAIAGGGYLPEHNFAFDDLTEAQKAEVKQANPSVGLGVREYWDEYGMDDQLAGRIKTLLGLESAAYDRNWGFVLRKWGSEEEFLRDCGDREARQAQAFVETGESNYDSPTIGDLTDLVDKLDEDGVRNMGTQLKYDHPREMREWYAGFDPADKAAVVMAVEDLFEAYIRRQEIEYDKALKAKRERIADLGRAEDDTWKVEGSPEERAEERARLEKEVKDSNKYREVWAKVPVVGNRYSAYMSGGPDQDTVAEQLEQAIELAVRRSEAEGAQLERSGGGWVQIIEDEVAVALAERAETAQRRASPPDEPSVSVDYDWDVFNEDRAADSLRYEYSRPPKRPDVDKRQRRLFPEPKTDEQAKRRGITVSRLTNPLFLPAEAPALPVY